MQSQLRKRFGSSLITVAYTYSKAMNNMNGGDSGDGTLFRTYPVSTNLAWGRAGFDRTHTLQISYVLEAPFGRGHMFLNHGPAAVIFGGWQVSGTVSRFSGVPFTVGSSIATNAAGQSQTANQVNPVVAILGGHDVNTPYFDGAAFANPVASTLGTAGRNILRGPGFFNLDARVSRTFSFLRDGRLKFQLLGEAFNLANHANFANPAATFNAQTTRADGSINYNGYSVITQTCGGCNPRQLQVGARLTF